jgi:GT2 family glycosyltransferase
MHDKDPIIGVVVINYKNPKLTTTCISEILKSENVFVKPVIVDNASEDDSLSYFKNKIPEIPVLSRRRNGGYAEGNNAGISFLMKQDVDFLCIVNNDVKIKPSTLIEMVQSYPPNELAIVGPVILEASSTIIQSAGGMNNLWKGNSWNLHKGIHLEQLRAKSLQEVQPSYISGAFMFFSISTYVVAGPLPTVYFLYYEENEWCVQAQLKGISVKVFPTISVNHIGSASTGKSSRLTTYLMRRNRALFEKRNASKLQFISFLCYLFAHYIRDILTQRRVDYYKDYVDGLTENMNIPK